MAGFVVKPFGDHLWMVKSSYFSPALREAAYQVPGIRFDYGPKAYVGYPDAVEVLLKELERRKLRFDASLFNPEELLAKAAPEPVLPVAREGRRIYQNRGVDFFLWQGGSGALLADAPRLGKSCVSLTSARALKARTLVVCPSHVVGVWARSNHEAKPPRKCEVEKWWLEAF